MKIVKTIAVILLIGLVGIQFIPTKQNQSNSVPKTDFLILNNPPKNIRDILQVSCYDCHGGIGDAFRDIKVEKSSFSIENLYGGCDKTFEVITFKYDENLKDFYLHKIRTEDYSCREAENLNGEIKITEIVKTQSDFGLISFEEYNF